MILASITLGTKSCCRSLLPSRACHFHGDHIVVAPDVTLNPGGADYGKEFTRKEAARLLLGNFNGDGQTVVIAQPVNVLLGLPKQIPQALTIAFPRARCDSEDIKRMADVGETRGEANESWMLVHHASTSNKV